MNHRSRKLVLLSAVGVAACASGCSWFGGGSKNDALVTAPVADNSAYTPPIKTDPKRTGDYRREGVLGVAPATAPAAAGPAVDTFHDTRPLVLLPPTTRPIASSYTAPEYLVLGSIVANVNGSPIYGHELMKQVAPLLRARARDVDEGTFRRIAQTELERQRRTLIGDELYFAAAQRNTTADEAREAQQRTMLRREQMISAAGGSLEMARELAREQGDDFDALLKKEERRQLVGIYFRKRIFPRVDPSGEEMRRYYEQNRDKVFSVPASASIRLIRIDIKDVGSESAALGKINDAKRRADAGESFEALCQEFNRMPLLVENKGLIGPLSKGAYVIAAVDDAIWPLTQGTVSDVIKTKDAYYLFQVVNKENGRTQSFEEPAVQAQIKSTLSGQRQALLIAQARDSLEKDAVIQSDDKMLQPIVEMAMQMYPAWHEPR